MTRRTPDETARDDIAAELSGGDGSTVTYACDGCGETMEVAKASLSIAAGDIYCDACGGRR